MSDEFDEELEQAFQNYSDKNSEQETLKYENIPNKKTKKKSKKIKIKKKSEQTTMLDTKTNPIDIPLPNTKKRKTVLFIIMFIFLIIMVAFIWYFGKNPKNNNNIFNNNNNIKHKNNNNNDNINIDNNKNIKTTDDVNDNKSETPIDIPIKTPDEIKTPNKIETTDNVDTSNTVETPNTVETLDNAETNMKSTNLKEVETHVGPTNEQICYKDSYLKDTLKEQLTVGFGALFLDLKDTYRYEASGVITVGDSFYVAFDSLYKIGKVNKDLLRSTKNRLISTQDIDYDRESGYEGITYNPINDHLYILTELDKIQCNDNSNDFGLCNKIIMSANGQTVLLPVIRDTTLNENDVYSVVSKCVVNHPFTHINKGYESLQMIYNSDTEKYYFIALCEGNHCTGGAKGLEKGNGRMVIIEMDTINTDAFIDYSCMYNASRIINLPNYIDFTDYSAFTFKRTEIANLYKLAITSQEDSKLWIGTFDFSDNKFNIGKIYNFPRNDNCQIKFCNIEGINFINDRFLIAVSDETKRHGKQSFVCQEKDQSIHLFSIPQ